MTDELNPQAGQDTGQDAGDNEQPEQPSVDELLRELKALRRENAKWRTQLRAVEEQQQAKAKAEMTDLERLQAELAAEREARTRAEQARLQIAVKSQIIAAAAKASFADPEDAYRMIDPATLDVADDGTVSGLDDAVKGLLKAKPYLAKQAPGAFSPTNPAGGAAKQSDAEILKEIYGGRKADIWGGQGGGVFWNTNATE